MDTSEQYIKMCDCSEIQGKWEIGVDAMMHPATDSHDYTQMILKPHPKYKTQKACITIWLPRQDQIQEMHSKAIPQIQLVQINQVVNPDPFIEVAKEEKQSIIEYQKFKNETLGRRAYFRGYYSQFQTWEQLWLAFYMHEKHQKFWGKEGWVNNIGGKNE